MRHSTITLTMDTYGHLFPGDEAEAVDKLALCGSQVIAAAGGSTTGSTEGDIRCDTERHQETPCETTPSDGTRRNSLSEKALEDVVRRGETEKRQCPALDSNQQPID